CFKPDAARASCVMWSIESQMYSRFMSLGETHGIGPSQNADSAFEGVAPLTTSTSCLNGIDEGSLTHSAGCPNSLEKIAERIRSALAVTSARLRRNAST